MADPGLRFIGGRNLNKILININIHMYIFSIYKYKQIQLHAVYTYLYKYAIYEGMYTYIRMWVTVLYP